MPSVRCCHPLLTSPNNRTKHQPHATAVESLGDRAWVRTLGRSIRTLNSSEDVRSFVRYRYGIGVPPPQRLRLRPLSQESPCPSHTGRPQPGARCMINMIGIRGDRELEPPRCRVCPGVGVGDCLRDRASIALEGGGITAMGEMASHSCGISACGVAKARAGSEASAIAR